MGVVGVVVVVVVVVGGGGGDDNDDDARARAREPRAQRLVMLPRPVRGSNADRSGSGSLCGKPSLSVRLSVEVVATSPAHCDLAVAERSNLIKRMRADDQDAIRERSERSGDHGRRLARGAAAASIALSEPPSFAGGAPDTFPMTVAITVR